MPSKNYSRKTLGNKNAYEYALKKNTSQVIKGKRYQDPTTKEAKLLKASQRLKSQRLGTINMQKTDYGDEISSAYHILQSMGITPSEQSTTSILSEIKEADKTAFMAKSNLSQRTKMRNFKAGTISPKFTFTDYRGSFYNLDDGPSRAKQIQIDQLFEKRTMIDPSEIALKVIEIDTGTFGHSRQQIVSRQNAALYDNMTEPKSRKSGLPYADRRQAPPAPPTAGAVPPTSRTSMMNSSTDMSTARSGRSSTSRTSTMNTISTTRRTSNRGTGY
tara:strand:+ start:10288 stop:11109 length:822 start_codon:yes stop_codon:yes gene_type:complete